MNWRRVLGVAIGVGLIGVQATEGRATTGLPGPVAGAWVQYPVSATGVGAGAAQFGCTPAVEIDGSYAYDPIGRQALAEFRGCYTKGGWYKSPVYHDIVQTWTFTLGAWISRGVEPSPQHGRILWDGALGAIIRLRSGATDEWSSGHWRQVATNNLGPIEAVFDQANGTVVALGGMARDSNGALVGETPVLTGTTWSEVTSQTAPIAVDPSDGGVAGWQNLAYDPISRTVLAYVGDGTWEWDGVNWQRVAVSGPSPGPRSGYAMTGTSGKGGIYLYGGYNINAPNPIVFDMWRWDGTDWTNLASLPPSFCRPAPINCVLPLQPGEWISDPPAYTFPMFFDPAVDGLVMPLQGGGGYAVGPHSYPDPMLSSPVWVWPVVGGP